jgi:plastocyanin
MTSVRQLATLAVGLLAVVSGFAPPATAATPEFEIEIRNHLFHPDRITVPAGKKVKLVIINRDPTPEEFESYELNREKVIMGGRKVKVFIGPLAPGEYPFFGEFHPQTALGTVVAR